MSKKITLKEAAKILNFSSPDSISAKIRKGIYKAELIGGVYFMSEKYISSLPKNKGKGRPITTRAGINKRKGK